MLQEFARLQSALKAPLQDIEPAPQQSLMGAFNARDQSSNAFEVPLELPPLPTLARSVLIDPENKRLGEQLVTQTFFSYGLMKDDKKRLDATLIEVQKSGLATVGEMQLQTASPKKRDMKLLKKE